MSARDPAVEIHLAFRFHVNFYHSYRGDTPDEDGFGKDIRIIRNTIRILDDLGRSGIPVRGTWDFDNYFTLEKIIPEYAPDLLSSWQRRVDTGADEVNLMSYNNGLLSAHTQEEFVQVMDQTMHNSAGSGLLDLFSVVRPIVRPQEMMYTPSHVRMYRDCGVEAISLFYSAIPFNAFSNFIPALSLAERHNILKLKGAAPEDSIMLVPANNHGDIGDHISLLRWLKTLHRSYKRQRLEDPSLPQDLLLLIDLDADDVFWQGLSSPLLRRTFTTAGGFEVMVRSVSNLPFVRFTTPWSYLESHAPVGEIEINQDTADGGYDGYSNWAEKWSNHSIWTGIERSRLLEFQARRLLDEVESPYREQIEQYLIDATSERISSLSTTHFGLSMPKVAERRLKTARSFVARSLHNSCEAFKSAAHSVSPATLVGRGKATIEAFDCRTHAQVAAQPSAKACSIIWLKLDASISTSRVVVESASGEFIPSAVRGRDLVFVAETTPGIRVGYHVRPVKFLPDNIQSGGATVSDRGIANSMIRLGFSETGIPCNLALDGRQIFDTTFLRSAVRYRGCLCTDHAWSEVDSVVLGKGLASIKKYQTDIRIQPSSNTVHIERSFCIFSELPYVMVHTTIHYPETAGTGRRSSRADYSFDRHWREVMPCEITLPWSNPFGHYTVWKHNYNNDVSSYDLNYHQFTRNRRIASLNNQITNSWIAVTNGRTGLLLAQSGNFTNSFAFCPMRLRMRRDRQRVKLNPFGTYCGPQLRYQTAFTGIGRIAAVLVAKHLRSAAPSYEGHTESYSLLLAPYRGNCPPESIRADAQMYSWPLAVISHRPDVVVPASYCGYAGDEYA